jgi:hypothetical protein
MVQNKLFPAPGVVSFLPAFAANLHGDLTFVTVDVWVERYYPGRTHADIRLRVIRGAARLGIAPAEYQAIIWTKARLRAGKKAVSFNTVPGIWQLKFDYAEV